MSYLSQFKITLGLTIIFFNLFDYQVKAQINTLPGYRLRTNNRQSIDNYLIKSGSNYAAHICDSYTSSELKSDCQKIVGQAEFLDVNAVTLCELKFYISSKTLNCFTNISGKIYDFTELQQCGNSTNEYEIYQCLSQTGKLVELDNVISEIEPENTQQNSQSVCDSFTDSANQKNCQQILASSYFIDLSAVNLCQSKLPVSPQMLQCFEAINNKIYTPAEINQCSQAIKEANLLTCLSSAGDSFDSLNENESNSPPETINQDEK